jgi:hypothetical protein
MSHRPLIGIALAACLATTLSCAVSDPPNAGAPAGYDAPPAEYNAPLQSAARVGLPPMYRAFYDALEGEGDWVLIEPYGWVFRPAVNFDAWRPYTQGWWEPSEAFGWVWNSTDPFGWVTDHYGGWFYDSYQGWVWEPGPVWGPAWVGWVGAGDYIGWAPLAPAAYNDYSSVRGDVFTFALASQFGVMQNTSQALFVARPPAAPEHLTEISNPTRLNGVVFNRGPDFAMLQRLGNTVSPSSQEPDLRRVKLPAVQPPGDTELLQRTKRLLVVGQRQVANGPGEPMPPPAAKQPAPAPKAAPGGKPAPPDSLTKLPHAKQPKGTPKPAPPPGPGRAAPDTTRG